MSIKVDWVKLGLGGIAGYIIMSYLEPIGYASKKKDDSNSPQTAPGRPGGRTYPHPKDNSWPNIKLPNLGPANNDQPYYPGPRDLEPWEVAPGVRIPGL